MLLHKGLQARLGLEADVPGNFLAVLQNDDAGDAGYPVFHGKGRVFVYVDGVEAGVVLHDLF